MHRGNETERLIDCGRERHQACLIDRQGQKLAERSGS